MRPTVPDELVTAVNDAIRAETRVPPDRLEFSTRLEILLDEYDTRGERVNELKDRLENGSRLRSPLGSD